MKDLEEEILKIMDSNPETSKNLQFYLKCQHKIRLLTNLKIDKNL